MKKVFLTLAIAGLFTVTACNSAAEESKTEEAATEVIEDMNSEMEEVVETTDSTIQAVADTVVAKTEEVVK